MSKIENEVSNEKKKMSKKKKIIAGAACFVVVAGAVSAATIVGINKNKKEETTISNTDVQNVRDASSLTESNENNTEIANNSANQTENNNETISVDETKLKEIINKSLITIAKKDNQNSSTYYAKYFELDRKVEKNTLSIYVWAQYGSATENNKEESGTSLPLKLKISLNDYSLENYDLPPEGTYYPEYFSEISGKLEKLDGNVNDSLYGETYYEKNSENSTTNSTAKSDKDLVTELYSNKLSEVYSAEHRIDDVSIIDSSTLTELYPEATSEAIFAFVTYSIKDTDAIAGNGEISGSWVINKTACVYIDKVDGEYKIISDGTGW